MSEPVPDPRGLRDFLKANATVVAPGETLVIRTTDLTPNQMREYMDWLNYADEDGPLLPFRTVVTNGDGFGVVSATELKDGLRDLVRQEIAAQVDRERQMYPLRIFTSRPAPRMSST